MGFDLDALRAAVTAHGRVARVTIAGVRGSAPREVGAAMLVWDGGQSGTIGGGALEFAAAATAREAQMPFRISHHALGPELGQCCGGAVSVVTEVFDHKRLLEIPSSGYFARGNGPQPLAITRTLRDVRSGKEVLAGLYDQWLIEPITPKGRPLWIWGAGHVGRALVSVLAPLPDVDITWVDDAMARFPDHIAPTVTALPAPQMPKAMALAPTHAQHLILTYSHEIDLALCHAALKHGFEYCGLIGSKTKWARFRKRLTELGHSPDQIARITCPIGDPALGKYPQAIAIGVAQDVLKTKQRHAVEGHPHDAYAADA